MGSAVCRIAVLSSEAGVMALDRATPGPVLDADRYLLGMCLGAVRLYLSELSTILLPKIEPLR
jgi:hypothetical protein